MRYNHDQHLGRGAAGPRRLAPTLLQNDRHGRILRPCSISFPDCECAASERSAISPIRVKIGFGQPALKREKR